MLMRFLKEIMLSLNWNINMRTIKIIIITTLLMVNNSIMAQNNDYRVDRYREQYSNGFQMGIIGTSIGLIGTGLLINSDTQSKFNTGITFSVVGGLLTTIGAGMMINSHKYLNNFYIDNNGLTYRIRLSDLKRYNTKLTVNN